MALIVDPALQASVIRQFNLKGELAPFNLTENVVPIFDIGQLLGAPPTVVTTTLGQQGVRVGTAFGPNALQTRTPRINDGDVTDGGTAVNPAALAVLVDSGQLAGGEQMVSIYFSANVVVDFRIEWRNAANTATIASWTILQGGPSAAPFQWGPTTFAITTNERIRVVNVGVVVGTVSSCISTTPSNPSAAT